MDMTSLHSPLQRTWSLRLGAWPAFLLLLCGCHLDQRVDTPSSSVLLGKTTSAVLACAGLPIQQSKQGASVIMKYYKEASILEESGVHSKGSVSKVHRGCWVDLLVEADHVTGVQFRPVPPTETDTQSCRDLFESCGR